MKKLYKSPLIVLFCGLFSSALHSQCTTTNFTNPSFEGPAVANALPPGWSNCNGTTSDTQPGEWGISTPASNGATWCGLVSVPGWQETASQVISPCLNAGQTYSFTIDILKVDETSDGGGDCDGLVQLWGGQGSGSACDMTEMLWSSPTLVTGGPNQNNWITYTMTFTPTQNTCQLTFQAIEGNCPSGSGDFYMGLDNISPIQPNITVTPSVVQNVSCFGGNDGSVTANVTAGGTPPFTYTWNPGAIAGQTASNLVAGTYTVTVNDGAGCSITNTVTVTQPPVVNITLTPTAANCGTGGSIVTAVTGGTPPFTYSWNPGGSTAQNPTNLNPGTYTVTVTGGGPCTYTASTTILNGGAVTSTYSQSPNQCFTGNTFNFTSTGTTGGGTTYNWTFPGGTPAASTAQNPTGITYAAPGTYAVNYTVTSGGCSGSATTNVTIFPDLAFTVAGNDTICQGSNATWTVNGPAATYTWNPGALTGATQTLSPAATTNYTINGVDANGCASAQTFTISVAPTMVITLTPTDAACAANCNGQIVGSVAPAAGPFATYSYSWSNAATTSTITNLCANTYTLTTTDLAGCTATANAPITYSITPVASFTQSPDQCLAVNSFNFTNTGSTGAGWTYNWTLTGGTPSTSTAQNPAAVTYSAPGNFPVSLTVTNNGCSATANSSVNVFADLVFTVAGNDTICQGSNATWTVTGPAATYTWNPGGLTGTSQTLSPVATTNYTINAADVNGCTGTQTFTISVAPTMVITLTPTDAACAANCNGQIAASIAPAAGPFATYSYSWSNAATTATITNLCANTYTLTTTDLAGCTATANAPITYSITPVASFTQSPDQCLTGNSYSFTNTGSTGAGWTYNWILTGGTPSTSVAQNPAGVTYAASGNFPVSLTVTNNGCSATANGSVNVFPNLAFTVAGNDTICQGNNTTWTITGPPATYTWNPGALTGTSQTLAPVATTNYTINGVDGNGCASTQTFTISVAPTMTLQMGGFPATCNGNCDGQAVVLVTPNAGPFAFYTYLWDNNATTPSVNNLCASTVTVTVTDLAGCTATNNVVITEPAAVTATSSALTNVTCNAACDGSVLITPGGGTGAGYTYTWAPAGTGNNPVNLCNGSYTVTVRDGNGCPAPVSFIITEPASITASVASVTPICIGQTENLTATGGGGNGGYTYTWTAGTVPATGAVVAVNPIVTTSYTVTVTDALNCPTATASVTIVVSPPLSVVASADDTICNGQATSISAVGSGGDGTYTYTWAPVTNPVIGNPVTASPIATTTYTVTVTDACGTPPANDSVIVTVNPIPVLTITAAPPAGCAPWCATFTGTSVPASAMCNWTFSNGATALDTCTPQVCFPDSGSYGATLNVTDINGCTNTLTTNNLVNVYPNPVAAFSFGPQPTTELESTIFFTDLSQGSNINNWLWSFGNVEDSVSIYQNPQFTYTAAGSYTVQLVVTNVWGCVDTIPETVVIDQDFTFYAPNAFSPNGDGTNDFFSTKGIGIDTTKFQLWIYDRWGNMIFYTDDFFKEWDGKVQGHTEEVQEDVYVWKVKLNDFKERKHSYVGHVTVVK